VESTSRVLLPSDVEKGGYMKTRFGIAATILLTITSGSILTAGPDWTFERYLLDKEGGVIEKEATRPDDKETRDAVRRELQEQAQAGLPLATSAMQENRKQIQYRYENTRRGGRIHITAKNHEGVLAVQGFLRSMNKSGAGTVLFDYAADTSLIVVPVIINNQGPYRFLLDTGATKTILSAAIADKLHISKGRIEMLLSAGGNLPISVRRVDALELGFTRLENVEIAVGNLAFMKSLKVDGLLGSDYLRRFKISIDYDNRSVEVQPSQDSDISLLLT
jgi:predicted aspartyl protease